MKRIGKDIIISICLVVSFCALTIAFISSSGDAEQSEINPAAATAPKSARPANVTSDVDLVKFYCVENGEIKSCSFTGADLNAGTELQMSGYVCGITVFCRKNLNITMNGRELRNIGENEDALFLPEGPEGNVNFHWPLDETEELSRSSGDPTKSSMTWYSLFPKVKGDALYHQADLDLVFTSPAGVHSVGVRQRACYSMLGNCSDSDREQTNIEFPGSSHERMRQQATDFEDRLEAISDGINLVEATLGSTLVSSIKILDCCSPLGAVACDESNSIWMYANTFLNESIEELSVISTHEALHILVDRLQLAKDSEVRELFARLWGYDDFSQERFDIVTSGFAPLANPQEAPHRGVFFSFVNERNFLDKMKGGHAHTGVEEFCVSLLHSLLFVERIEENLEKPLWLGDPEDKTHTLTIAEKEYIVKNYLVSIETLLRALPQDNETFSSLISLLRDRWRKVNAQVLGKKAPAV